MNMETFFGFGLTQILIGFCRASGMIATAPVFQNRSIPVQVKMIFAFGLALVTAPYIKNISVLNQFTFGMAVFTLIQEVLVGMIIGFMVNFIFYAIQMAGYYFDVSLGFSVVNIIDPNTGTEMPILGQFNYILALIIFLAIDGHHALILSLIQSYGIVKPGMLFIKKEAIGIVVAAFSRMFYLGFQIGLPVVGAIFLTDVAMGIVSKLIPQINVFVAGFSVKIILGILLLIVFLPVYVHLVAYLFGANGEAFDFLRHMLKQMRL